MDKLDELLKVMRVAWLKQTMNPTQRSYAAWVKASNEYAAACRYEFTGKKA